MDRKLILQNLITDAGSNLQLAKDQLSGLSDHQRNWKPGPKRWSVNQCLEHINITNREWIEKLKPVLQHGVKSDNSGLFKHGLIGSYMIRTHMPGNKTKFKTKKSFDPPSALDSQKVWGDFMQLQQQWIDTMKLIQPYDLDKNKAQSPFASFIKYKLGDATILNNLHTHRHLNQAINVTKEEQFPK